jgi:hypothetical protein
MKKLSRYWFFLAILYAIIGLYTCAAAVRVNFQMSLMKPDEVISQKQARGFYNITLKTGRQILPLISLVLFSAVPACFYMGRKIRKIEDVESGSEGQNSATASHSNCAKNKIRDGTTDSLGTSAPSCIAEKTE